MSEPMKRRFKFSMLVAVATLIAASLVTSQAIGGDTKEPPAKPSENAVVDAETSPDEAEGDEEGAMPAEPAKPEPTPAQKAAGAKAFGKVYSVLMSPRCMNCHPAGDAPLQTDQSKPHAFNISRASVEAGLDCSTCHQDRNADEIGAPGGPPGAPNWHLPEKEMPLIFEGRTPAQLCAQLKDPEQNGHKTLDQLLHHVGHDPLVLWGWNPGGKRTKPPLAHDAFVAEFKTWVESGGACPE
jgi:hypothetical protein